MALLKPTAAAAVAAVAVSEVAASVCKLRWLALMVASAPGPWYAQGSEQLQQGWCGGSVQERRCQVAHERWAFGVAW